MKFVWPRVEKFSKNCWIKIKIEVIFIQVTSERKKLMVRRIRKNHFICEREKTIKILEKDRDFRDYSDFCDLITSR